jgi:hypothetical protein
LSDAGIVGAIKIQLNVAWISFECVDVKSGLFKQLPLIQDFKHLANIFHMHYFLLA